MEELDPKELNKKALHPKEPHLLVEFLREPTQECHDRLRVHFPRGSEGIGERTQETRTD